MISGDAASRSGNPVAVRRRRCCRGAAHPPRPGGDSYDAIEAMQLGSRGLIRHRRLRPAGVGPPHPLALSREGRGGRTALETVAAPSQSPCARWPRRRAALPFPRGEGDRILGPRNRGGGGLRGFGCALEGRAAGDGPWGAWGAEPPTGKKSEGRVGGPERRSVLVRDGGVGGAAPHGRRAGRPRGLIRHRGAERRCAPGPHPRPLPRGAGAGGREGSRSGRPGRQGASGGSIIQRATRGSPSVRRQSSESGSAASRRSAPRIWRRSQRRSHMFVPASASSAWWASR